MTPIPNTGQTSEGPRSDSECKAVTRLAPLTRAAGVRRVVVILSPALATDAVTDEEQARALGVAVGVAVEVALRCLAAGPGAEVYVVP